MFTGDLFYDTLKTALTFMGGLLAALIGQQAAKRNAKAAEKTAELDHTLRPLELANATWEKLLPPMIDRVDALEAEVKNLRKEQHEREGTLMKSLSLLVHWGQWIEAGASPPPPFIPDWLRTHMIQAIHDLDHPPNKE